MVEIAQQVVEQAGARLAEAAAAKAIEAYTEQERRAKQAAREAIPRPQTQDVVMPEGQQDEEDAEGEEPIPQGWEDIFPQEQQEPKSKQAIAMATLLEKAPEQGLLTKARAEVILYKKLPRTPAARADPKDKQLQRTQVKLELALNLIVQHLDFGSGSALAGSAAYLRSAYEDLQQDRRQLMAAGQRSKLNKREDNKQPRLLSEEEERKIQEGKAKGKAFGKGQRSGGYGGWFGGRGRGQGYWNAPRSNRSRSTSPAGSARSWSSSNSRGGKGKGRS